MMKFNLVLLFVAVIASCTNSRKKYIPEAKVLEIIEKKYDTLQASLKDSLARGIYHINDYDHVFSGEEKIRLDSLIKNFKNQTGFNLAVFTFDSMMTSKDSVNEVTQIVGIKNKLSITIGISLPYREIYIWNDSLVNNTVLSQIETKAIIDEKFVPCFKTGGYFNGTTEGIKAITQMMKIKTKDRVFQKKRRLTSALCKPGDRISPDLL